ncbi:MAG: NIPSNAP family protein [Bryobacteraceae bacterium]
MNRRHFVTAAASAGAASVPASAAGGNAIIELRYYRLRNGSQVQRTSEFLSKSFAPAARKAGAGPIGFFSSVIAEQGPFALALVAYPSLAAVGEVADRMMADKQYRQGWEQYHGGAELGFIRMENMLLKAFDVQPQVVPPPAGGKGHIFELRTYESNNAKAAAAKIKMFNEGEAGIFKRLGFAPVFFGETLVGRNLPNLMYMTTLESLADREKKWASFSADPEWQKMRAIPEYSDSLIVSNTSISLLRPLPFSEIK